MRRQAIATVVFAALSSHVFCLAEVRAETVRAGSEAQDVIPKQWLDKKTSIEQAEAQNMVEGVPFGARSQEWKSLKNSFKAGDDLWTYCSPFESFKAHAGRCGIAIVRDGKVVMHLVTIMN